MFYYLGRVGEIVALLALFVLTIAQRDEMGTPLVVGYMGLGIVALSVLALAAANTISTVLEAFNDMFEEPEQ